MRDKKKCPQCGETVSKRIKVSFDVWPFSKWGVLKDPPTIIKLQYVYHCSNCGHEWTE